MKQLIQILIFCCICAYFSTLISCEPFVPSFTEETIEAMRPIYASESDFTIAKEASKSLNESGKIYVYGSILLVNDVGTGIHVLDNSDPSDPKPLYFLSIPGNTDMAVKEGIIYANNHTDLVALRLTASTFEEVSRIENHFIMTELMKYPPGSDVYFECVEEDLGRVIGWEKAWVTAPNCYKK